MEELVVKQTHKLCSSLLHAVDSKCAHTASLCGRVAETAGSSLLLSPLAWCHVTAAGGRQKPLSSPSSGSKSGLCGCRGMEGVKQLWGREGGREKQLGEQKRERRGVEMANKLTESKRAWKSGEGRKGGKWQEKRKMAQGSPMEKTDWQHSNYINFHIVDSYWVCVWENTSRVHIRGNDLGF